MTPLSVAVLCANCETISDAKHDACPKCGSKSLINLGRILNREVDSQMKRRGGVYQT